MSGSDQPQNEENPTIRTLDLRHSAEGTSNIILIIPESVKKVEVAVTVASIAQRSMSRMGLPSQNVKNSNESKTMADSRSRRASNNTPILENFSRSEYPYSLANCPNYKPSNLTSPDYASEYANGCPECGSPWYLHKLPHIPPASAAVPTYIWLVTSTHPESTNMPAGIFSDEDKAWDWRNKQRDPTEWKLTPYILDYAERNKP